jgi:hypothetical protein
MVWAPENVQTTAQLPTLKNLNISCAKSFAIRSRRRIYKAVPYRNLVTISRR